MALPRISVVLPVRNEARCIGRLLDQLLQQTYPQNSYEIIVADGGSTDDTRSIVESRARMAPVTIRVVDNPGIRSGPGRNAGVAAASGEIIVFIDGHCEIPSPRLLEDTVQIFEETGADCLCRPQPLIAFSPQGMGRIIANVRASTLGHGRDSLIYDMAHAGFVHPASSGATYRRKIFAQLGGYDESFDSSEDGEFNIRVAEAGYKAYTDPRLAVYYEPRKTLSELFVQMLRYGIGRVRLAKKHPKAVMLSQWMPAVLLGILVSGILSLAIAIATDKWMAAGFAIPAVMVLLIIVVASMDLWRRHGWEHAFIGPIVYLVIYIGMGAGMWTEIVRSTINSASLSNTTNYMFADRAVAQKEAADRIQELRK